MEYAFYSPRAEVLPDRTDVSLLEQCAVYGLGTTPILFIF